MSKVRLSQVGQNLGKIAHMVLSRLNCAEVEKIGKKKRMNKGQKLKIQASFDQIDHAISKSSYPKLD